MVTQAIRGSYGCWRKTSDETRMLGHVIEVNQDIQYVKDVVHINLYALNAEMCYDGRISVEYDENWKIIVKGILESANKFFSNTKNW
jgi:hypothetical protein